MKRLGLLAIPVIVVALLIVLFNTLYVVNEAEQYVITQFGKPVGDPVTEPGLHARVPFVHQLQRFEKRFLEWDGDRDELPTLDKRFIWVDTYARWRIGDPLQFLKAVPMGEVEARRRLNDILDGLTRDTIARHNLIDVVRDSNRDFVVVPELGDAGGSDEEEFTRVQAGRTSMEQEVLAEAQVRTRDLGIEVLDFRFKRINYVPEVRKEVYARMISERKRIATQFRSEGEGEAARISGERERELKQITSEAYRTAEEIRGKADAAAADVYARSYNRDADFYRFLKTMETYRKTLDEETMLLLGTDNGLMRYLDDAK